MTVPSLSGHAIAYRWRSPPSVAGTEPVIIKVVPVTGTSFSSITHVDQLMCTSLFPHPLFLQSDCTSAITAVEDMDPNLRVVEGLLDVAPGFRDSNVGHISVC